MGSGVATKPAASSATEMVEISERSGSASTASSDRSARTLVSSSPGSGTTTEPTPTAQRAVDVVPESSQVQSRQVGVGDQLPKSGATDAGRQRLGRALLPRLGRHGLDGTSHSPTGVLPPRPDHRYRHSGRNGTCLLYTSDAADEEDSVDLGGRRIIKKKK